jgi:hypothetical protein
MTNKAVLLASFGFIASAAAQPQGTLSFVPLEQQQWEAMKRDLAEIPISAKGYQMVIGLLDQYERQAQTDKMRNMAADAAKAGVPSK